MKRKKDFDKVLLAAVGFLILVGIIMIYSASAMRAIIDASDDAFFFKRQIVWLTIGLLAIYLISHIDYHRYQKYAWSIILLSLGLLVVVLFMEGVSGARRWIDLKFVTFQPSEIFKFATVLFLAVTLACKKDKIKMFRSVLIPALPVLAIGFALILLEPNLGAVLVLSGVSLTLFFVAGVRKRILAIFTVSVTGSAAFMIFILNYKRDRIDSFLNTLLDPLQAGYQVKQSVLAIGSGGFWGNGIGKGSAKMLFLPAPHTDFIFATIAEEGGFILAFAVLTAIAIILWRGFRTATYAADLFGFYLALGVTTLLFCQSAINLMVATSLLPVTGLPLPLVSYGGSSLILTSVGLGVLLNISRHTVTTPQLFGWRKR